MPAGASSFSRILIMRELLARHVRKECFVMLLCQGTVKEMLFAVSTKSPFPYSERFFIGFSPLLKAEVAVKLSEGVQGRIQR